MRVFSDARWLRWRAGRRGGRLGLRGGGADLLAGLVDLVELEQEMAKATVKPVVHTAEAVHDFCGLERVERWPAREFKDVVESLVQLAEKGVDLRGCGVLRCLKR